MTQDSVSVPLIVGIGASAGGLEAFKSFFSAMPPDSGMAFILVQHLSPTYESMLVELLAHATQMTVVSAENGMKIEANHVYVIPPNATLTVKKSRLVIKKPAPDREQRRPIDSFFLSLAEDQEENAVCIILSGAGSDGAFGLTAVKEHGGITFAQAEFNHTARSGMPSNAAATGQVDFILPVEAMPAKLLEYQQHLKGVQLKKDSEGTRKDAVEYLPEIFSLINARVGHDFNHYKVKTLLRRIQRRMQVLQIVDVPGFIEVLKKEPAQLDLLFHDMLIGVTGFFRDPDAFQAFETEVIPRLLAGKGASDQIRIWVAGCSTGEEAYSIAILLAEALHLLPVLPKVLIFATDIDDKAIAFARSGRYPRGRLEGVSPERIKRWFLVENDYYVISPQIREMCVFSIHNLVKDPPFSRLDLISCRNLLIYLDGTLQNRLIPIFHYALRPGGILFLGASEGVGRQDDLFDVLDKKHRLFIRQDALVSRLPHYPLFGAGNRDIIRPEVTVSTPKETGFEGGARRVMERYSPVHVVIDRHNQVLSFSGQTGKYLDPTPGAASLDLFHLIQKSLRPVARSLLQQASVTQQRAVKEKIPFEMNGVTDNVTLIVEPIMQASGSAAHYVVIFQQPDSSEMKESDKAVEKGVHLDAEHLENELRATRARLQAALDEAEEANEDLKSANEEFQSINEELHSSNEELETSKEEMQSINEELQTVNLELNNKNQILQRLNSDLQNFLESTQIATLFLDESYCVRNFTPSIKDLFKLRENDIGRPVTEITNRLNYDGLESDIKKTLQSLTVFEREVYLPESDTTFAMHIRPYRTITKVVDGVVITFVNISDRKRHEEALSRLAAIVESSQDAIIGHTLDGRITSWNKGAEQIFGYSAEEIKGQSLDILFPEDRSHELPGLYEKLKKGEFIVSFQIQAKAKTDRPVEVSLTISPVRRDDVIVAASTIARDMTQWMRSEQQRVLLMAELDHRVKNTLATIQSIARQTIKNSTSPQTFYEVFEARLLSLSHTHNLLVESHWQGASLRQIVCNELSPFNSEQYSIEGEDINITSRQIISLGMIIHELTTNAAKYGALSVLTGHVAVSWTVDKAIPLAIMLKLNWVESGGPPVATPKRKGFGSKLIERSLMNEKQGKAELDFTQEGVRCFIQFQLDNHLTEPDNSPPL